MPDNEDEELPCRRQSDFQLAELRRELDSKHAQNRRDIHDIRNKQQEMLLEFAKLEGKVKPLMDNGQPGLVSRILTKLDEMSDTLTAVQVTQGENTGRRGEDDWWRTALVAVIVAIVSALAAHFWK